MPMEVKPEIETFAKIKVLGVGGSGNSAINRMISSKIRGIDFVAINTDAQALHHSKATTKIHVGKTTTRGLGAGMDPDLGRKAAEENQDEIHDLLKGTDMVFITCGLGGGTGTGASPVIAEIARDVGALTVAVVTKPFSFEGEQRRAVAERGLNELQEKVDTIITIPNDRLLQIIDKKTSLLEAFSIVDDVLRQGVQGISDLITVPGLINVDFADVKAIMENQGSALMGIGKGTGDNRAVEAAKAAIDSPLLELSIDGARGILFTVTGGPDLGMYEVNEAAKIITGSADANAKVIFGSVIDETKKDEISITVIATGFGERGKGSGKRVSTGTTVGSYAPMRDRAVSGGPFDRAAQTAGKNPVVPPRPVSRPASKPAPDEGGSDEDLEIPAFIRKKMM
ncbi:MAG: cell division protein FtsZ [Candidatus Kerfeldbacteria bacterium]|nr:cell division protein FtsZ [Candidatus Kerfeldbacteria bacterium]